MNALLSDLQQQITHQRAENPGRRLHLPKETKAQIGELLEHYSTQFLADHLDLTRPTVERCKYLTPSWRAEDHLVEIPVSAPLASTVFDDTAAPQSAIPLHFKHRGVAINTEMNLTQFQAMFFGQEALIC